ncbi:hypothetical protein P280DRAFT_422007 [Massarina eburnea CBS 473.64]|uniref:Zn(2)-C6 fungal-type domain-containing protein n=1 Tax=Massarina eburnea CBS 473.64 TaxID=1395130 RepID=A0A6A6S7V1_9PLEO|nr:hypothetical protein P280DRAFT_422007 [Massarina eburnea CBS 473.64]
MSSHPQHAGRAFNPAKVAIPRLDRRGDEPPRKQPKIKPDRVPRACMGCRAKKIRCNGVQPACKTCSDNATHCVYASSRKDRLKTATEHNEDMMQLLRSLRNSVGESDRDKIDDILSQVANDVGDAASTLQRSPDKFRSVDEEGEANVSATVGTNEDLDNMNEDIMSSEQSRATGYVGKNSEVQWLRQLHYETDAGSHDPSASQGPYGPPGTSDRASEERAEALRQRQTHNSTYQQHTSMFNFNLDDEAVDMDFMVDPLALPTIDIANRLVRCYIDNVHNSVPILPKKAFTNEFFHHYASIAQETPHMLSQKWQAMLNLVFAIGAVYSHLTEADWRGDERDHFVYYSRAWALSLKDPWWFSHPDLQQTQITGLLAIYYLAIGHTNRSWVVIGMAVRSGFGLGLHVRNEDRTATFVKKEVLARTWWGLYTLEMLLSVITGRPSVGIESYCSVSLPLPISDDEFEETRIQALFGTWARPTTTKEPVSLGGSSEPPPTGSIRDPSNSGTYLTSTVKLVEISQRVLTEIYSPGVKRESWKQVQQTISEILEQLESWASSLPPGLSVTPHQHGGGDHVMTYERNNLKVFYHSTKILTTRPCICRLDRRIPNQSKSSNDSNEKTAAICVTSAKAITALLPDALLPENIATERYRIYETFPWWAVVHYIMQSLAILMLELSHEASSRDEQSDTMTALKKLVRWLRTLRGNNGMARRAHSIVLDILKKMAARIPIDIADLLAEDQTEPAYADDTQAQSNLFTQGHVTDEFLGHYNASQQFPDYLPTGSYPPRGNPVLHMLNSPIPNLLITEFDQYNPLPFGNGEVFMGQLDYGEPQAGSSGMDGASGDGRNT